jgi:hypothetical protein
MNFAVGLLFVTSISWLGGATAQSQGCIELPAPNAYKAGKVRDANQWQNPYLVVYPKWVELITGLAREKEKVPLSGLEKALRSLPATDWPYGRIVAVQEASIRSGSKLDDKLISQNETKVQRILTKLCVKISRWPA